MSKADNIDLLAQAWRDLEERQGAIERAREALRGKILDAVDSSGQLAERSSKTRVAEGVQFDLRVTQSLETRIDQRAARVFLEECPANMAELIFRREEKITLLESPDRLPGCAALPAKLHRLFSEAVSVRPRAPRIEARRRVPETNPGERTKAGHA